MILPIADGEPLGRREGLEADILVSREELTITRARHPGGERIAGPHVHSDHTDAFYVLEGELGFVVGQAEETVTMVAGGFLAAPPGVTHSFRTAGERPARWLTIHAPDGGFGKFMRGIRDGVESEWDISPVPSDGGLPASAAVVSHGARCALPDLGAVEWEGGGPHDDMPLELLGDRTALLFVIEGELEARLGAARQAIGPDTLVSVPRDERRKLSCRGCARVLVIATPSA